jgi:hypothetical protein
LRAGPQNAQSAAIGLTANRGKFCLAEPVDQSGSYASIRHGIVRRHDRTCSDTGLAERGNR